MEAATYIGVSPSTFDRMVKAGGMPPPKKFAGTTRKIWDQKAIDKAFDGEADAEADAECSLADMFGQADELEKKKLIDLAAQGLNSREIAFQLQTTAGAVARRAQVLGLTLPPLPRLRGC